MMTHEYLRKLSNKARKSGQNKLASVLNTISNALESDGKYPWAMSQLRDYLDEFAVCPPPEKWLP